MLHYGQTVFDGYKAFRGEDGQARIFRPWILLQDLFSPQPAFGFDVANSSVIDDRHDLFKILGALFCRDVEEGGPAVFVSSERCAPTLLVELKRCVTREYVVVQFQGFVLWPF